jgi:molybdopterin-dependent oxidoreductase alpha subunit
MTAHPPTSAQSNLSAQVPIQKEQPKISPPPQSSVGLSAVTSALEHVFKYTKPREALTVLNLLNQQKGIDCPGCAWPDPKDHRSKLGEYCENGVKAVAEEIQEATIGKAFFQKYTISDLLNMSDFELGKAGRLIEPMILKGDAALDSNLKYEPISWTEAFELCAKAMGDLSDPNEAVFYTSGRTSNEAAYLYQLFVRQLGTNNLPDCSNMCHESSGKALIQTLGIGKGSVTLEDFDEAEVILVIGQNPGTNHPRMLSALERCKENGGKIISINPLPEAGLIKFVNPQRPIKLLKGGTALCDLFLQVKINADVPLLKAIMKGLVELDSQNPNLGVLDHAFMKEKTLGGDAVFEDLKQYDFESLVIQSGVERSLVKQAIDLLAGSKKIIACWAMGLTQHLNAVENIKEVVNLLLMKGAIGKPGAGTCPVRGHSNVQGDRTMGIWEAPPEAFLDRLGHRYGFSPPRAHGYHVVSAIEAMDQEKVKFFFAMGGNFLSATPDTEFTGNALRKVDFTIHVSTKLNRSHLVHGKTALILPCLGRTEIDIQKNGAQFVSVENSMGVVQLSQGRLNPKSKDLMSEPAIVANLADAYFRYTGKSTNVHWLALIEDYDRIRTEIQSVIPGFDRYNERVREANGFALPNGAREGIFKTAQEKANFTVVALPNLLVKADEFVMMTIRSHDQYNTTIYGLDDRYRGIQQGRRVVLINPMDLSEKGFKDGDLVDLESCYEGVTRQVQSFRLVSYPITKGCLATYFPETNPLIPITLCAIQSHTPVSKSVIVKIKSTTLISNDSKSSGG